MTAPRQRERSTANERTITLWLVAVLLAQVVLLWWFFERIYGA